MNATQYQGLLKYELFFPKTEEKEHQLMLLMLRAWSKWRNIERIFKTYAIKAHGSWLLQKIYTHCRHIFYDNKHPLSTHYHFEYSRAQTQNIDL